MKKYKYGCLMLKVSVTNWEDYKSFIGEENLYIKEDEFGFVEVPHVSITYGLRDDGSPEYLEKITHFVSQLQGEIPIHTSEISIFDSNNEYDVVKFDIESDALYTLHKLVEYKLDHTCLFPTFEPHMTIAYVKSGLGRMYKKKLEQPLTFKSDIIVYSRPDRSLIDFKL